MKRFLILLSLLFCATATAQTINWYDGNQETQTTCNAGDTITPPTPIGKYGYHFKEWIISLPGEYEELRYIEGNTNTQYINTGIVPNSNMSMSAKIQLMSDTESTFTVFFGGRTQLLGGFGVASMWSPSELIFDWFGSSASDRYSVSATRTVGDILEYSVNNSLVTIKRNGTVAGTHQFTPTGTSTQPLYLNGMNNAGSLPTNNSAKARIYRFTIEGICDMRPARRKSDNVVGMYDTIRNQFFTNAGTGSFTAGPAVTE